MHSDWTCGRKKSVRIFLEVLTVLLWVLPESVSKDEQDTRRSSLGHLAPFADFPTHSLPFAGIRASGELTVLLRSFALLPSFTLLKNQKTKKAKMVVIENYVLIPSNSPVRGEVRHRMTCQSQRNAPGKP